MPSLSSYAPLRTALTTDPRLRWGLRLIAGFFLLAVISRLAGMALQAGGQSFPLEVTAWPALIVYVLGSLALGNAVRKQSGSWAVIGLTRRNLGRSLLWGVGIGVFLMLADWINTYLYYRAGNPPMVEMERLLVEMRLVYLFPLLTVAEEILWRGVLALGLFDAGMNRHLVVLVTTAAYALNHFVVAPVGVMEQTLMTMMALPLGIIGGYIVLATRNSWGALALHLLTVVSMIVDIYWMPTIAAWGR